MAGRDTTVLKLKQGNVSAERDVAAALRVALGSPVFEIWRVRMFEGAPLVALEAFFPPKIARLVSTLDVAGLFIPALRQSVDEEIWEEHQQIDAIVAGKFADILQTAPEAPILCVKRLFLDSKGKPVVFFRENFRADKYFYTVRLPQKR